MKSITYGYLIKPQFKNPEGHSNSKRLTKNKCDSIACPIGYVPSNRNLLHYNL